MVGAAIEAGYRHIDTAQGYGNEEGVGQAVREARSPVTRCSSPPSERTRDQGYDSTFRWLEGNLKRLGLD